MSAAAIVGREEIPRRLRFLLNVESGLNDGLALPLVVVGIAFLGASAVDTPSLVLELVGRGNQRSSDFVGGNRPRADVLLHSLSKVSGLLILEQGVVQGEYLLHLVAIVIFASIIAHSSTGVIVARWFRPPEAEQD